MFGEQSSAVSGAVTGLGERPDRRDFHFKRDAKAMTAAGFTTDSRNLLRSPLLMSQVVYFDPPSQQPALHAALRG